MTIQIGDKTFAISRAGDFEARLIESTSFSLAENTNVLAGYTNPAYLARVLNPMLAEPQSLGELAEAIDAAGADAVRSDVLVLLTSAPEPAGKGGKAGGDTSQA